MEIFLFKELNAPKSVSVKIELGYAGNSVRPNTIIVTPTINGKVGKPFEFRQ